SSCQTTSNPMPSKGSSSPFSGSNSNKPVAFKGEVKAIASGDRLSVTRLNSSPATITPAYTGFRNPELNPACALVVDQQMLATLSSAHERLVAKLSDHANCSGPETKQAREERGQAIRST